MLLTITAVSPEVEDFVIELLIESDATFEDLHHLIRQACGWGASEPAIQGQRLQYLFDPDEGRGLLLEVSRIAFSRHIDEPICRRSHGTPPALKLIKEEAPKGPSREELLAQLNAAALADDDDDIEPTDDELFDIEELDLEGFDFNEG